MSKTISISGTTTVDVDYEEEIDIEELDDDQLLACVEEAKKRRLQWKTNEIGDAEREYVLEAYEHLQGRRVLDAISMLERVLWPSKAFSVDIETLNKFYVKPKHLQA